MRIRRAEERDIPRVLALLSQVLMVHAEIRPDIFIPGTTKYTREELLAKFENDKTPVFVAVDEEDCVQGYAFCVQRSQPFSNNMVPFESFYIDDLCVDEAARGQHIGQELFAYVKEEAKRRGCYEITLAVWEGNDSARAFYERMGLRPKETIMEFIL